jgi:hypothetical protein
MSAARLIRDGFRAMGLAMLLLPWTSQASSVRYHPTASLKLTVGTQAPVYRAFEHWTDGGTVTGVYVWGVMPTAQSDCLPANAPAPIWFRNQTAFRVTVAPDISDKGDPVFFPDGDRRYVAILDRITQVGQIIEVKNGCRRAMAQLDTDRRVNALGTFSQFPPRLFFEQTPVGPVELRVRVYFDTDFDVGSGQTVEYTPHPW